MRRNFCEINDSVAWKNGMRGVFITEGNGRRVGDGGEKVFFPSAQPSPRSLNLLIRAIPPYAHQKYPPTNIMLSIYRSHTQTL